MCKNAACLYRSIAIRKTSSTAPTERSGNTSDCKNCFFQEFWLCLLPATPAEMTEARKKIPAFFEHFRIFHSHCVAFTHLPTGDCPFVLVLLPTMSLPLAPLVRDEIRAFVGNAFAQHGFNSVPSVSQVLDHLQSCFPDFTREPFKRSVKTFMDSILDSILASNQPSALSSQMAIPPPPPPPPPPPQASQRVIAGPPGTRRNRL